MSKASFLSYPVKLANPKMRLICFPFAGGGASAYRQWPHYLPDFIEICAIQLPGRENRIKESPYHSIKELIVDLMPEISSILDKPFIIFGHSLGALIAYEAIKWLQEERNISPNCFFASSFFAPDKIPERLKNPYVDEKQLLRELIDMEGIPTEVLENEKLLNYVLPTAKVDFEMINKYEISNGKMINCPIMVTGGQSDSVVKSELLNWRDITTNNFRLELFPGDHFYFNNNPLFFEFINRELRFLSFNCN